MVHQGVSQNMPQLIIRQWRHHIYREFADGMDKLYAVTQQTDAPIGIGTRRTILQITLYGATDVSQLGAYLMVTPRHQVDFQ